jgi:hypothetical protein
MGLAMTHHHERVLQCVSTSMRRRHERPPIECRYVMLVRETPQEGVVAASECAWPMRRDLTEHGPDWVVRDDAMEGKRRPEALPQVDPIERAHKSILPPQETPQEGMPTALKEGDTCESRAKPPWKAIHELAKPFEARRA